MGTSTSAVDRPPGAAPSTGRARQTGAAISILNERFGRLMDEYQDGQVGDLDCEEGAQGTADLSNFSSVLDEFLAANADQLRSDSDDEAGVSSQARPAAPSCDIFTIARQLGKMKHILSCLSTCHHLSVYCFRVKKAFLLIGTCRTDNLLEISCMMVLLVPPQYSDAATSCCSQGGGRRLSSSHTGIESTGEGAHDDEQQPVRSRHPPRQHKASSVAKVASVRQRDAEVIELTKVRK